MITLLLVASTVLMIGEQLSPAISLLYNNNKVYFWQVYIPKVKID